MAELTHMDEKLAEVCGLARAAQRDGRKTAIIEKARESEREAADMMSTYLGTDADGLDGFEFLTMAESPPRGDGDGRSMTRRRARRGCLRTPRTGPRSAETAFTNPAPKSTRVPATLLTSS
jgi:hypothetical protein